MTWYYADAGRQVGPIEESALDDLVRSGVVRDDTLVWRDGMPNWQPHAAARGPRIAPIPAPAVPLPASGFCSECGRPYPMNQLVMIGNAAVCAQCKPIYLQRMREGGQAVGMRRYAGFWIRFVARVIDGVLLSVVMTIVAIPLVGLLGLGTLASGGDPARNIGPALAFIALYTLLSIGLQCAYEVYFVSRRGGTPGKLILGLRIIRADGSMLTAGQAVGRYLAYLLDGFTLTIGFLMAAFDIEKRSLHDRICDTRVIYAR